MEPQTLHLSRITQGRVGECTNHELLTPYPVLYEKDGEFVAQFKFTVLLMPNGPLRITNGTWDPECIQSEFSIKDEELRKLLTSQVSTKKTQKKKKKKAAAATTPSEEAAEETKENVDPVEDEKPVEKTENPASMEEGFVEVTADGASEIPS